MVCNAAELVQAHEQQQEHRLGTACSALPLCAADAYSDRRNAVSRAKGVTEPSDEAVNVNRTGNETVCCQRRLQRLKYAQDSLVSLIEPGASWDNEERTLPARAKDMTVTSKHGAEPYSRHDHQPRSQP
jgi:hypothetical protein